MDSGDGDAVRLGLTGIDERQGEVGSAGPQHRRGLRRLGLDQVESEARVPLVEQRHGGRDERGGGRREGRQPDLPGLQAGRRRELGLGAGQESEDLLAAAGEPLAVGCQPDAPADALEEHAAGLGLQPAQVVGDGRLAVVQLGRRRRHGAGAVQGDERFDAAEVDHPFRLAAYIDEIDGSARKELLDR